MNAKEREGGRRRRGMMTEERSKRKRDEDGLSRGQRKEECIPGRVNPWGLEWLTIPWIRAFHASSTNSCAFPRTCNQRRGYAAINPFLYHRRPPRSIPRFLISRDSPVNGS